MKIHMLDEDRFFIVPETIAEQIYLRQFDGARVRFEKDCQEKLVEPQGCDPLLLKCPRIEVSKSDANAAIVRDWITEKFGARCKTFEDTCATCRIWQYYDDATEQ